MWFNSKNPHTATVLPKLANDKETKVKEGMMLGLRGSCPTCAWSLGTHFFAHERHQVLHGQGMAALALHPGDGAVQGLQPHQPPSCVVQAGCVTVGY